MMRCPCNLYSSACVMPYAILLLLVVGARSYYPGEVHCDSSNFDRIVTEDVTSVVKFDVRNPHGPAVSEWRRFVDFVGGFENGLLDVVPVVVRCHHDDDVTPLNMDLARRFNVTFGGRPTVYLVRRGPRHVATPVLYRDESFTAANLIRFLQKFAAHTYFGLTGTLRCLDAEAATILRLVARADNASVAAAVVKRAERIVSARRLPSQRRPPTQLVHTDALPDDPAEAEEVCLAELESPLLFDSQRKEDAEYYLTIMRQVISNTSSGIHTPLDAKHAIARDLAAMNHYKQQGKHGDGLDQQQQRRRKARLERNLNILSTFRSPAAVDIADPSIQESQSQSATAAVREKKKRVRS